MMVLADVCPARKKRGLNRPHLPRFGAAVEWAGSLIAVGTPAGDKVTFRQALSAIWQRRLLIIAVIVLAVAAAAVFLVRQTPVYTSSTTVRMSSLAAAASSSGQIGTASVDFDPSSITSPAVLDAAAKDVGEPASATGAWKVTSTVTQATPQSQSKVITITANGNSAVAAQKHADAVAKSYNEYLTGQTAKAKSAAEAQAAKWTASAETYQAQVNANPANSIAQSNLQNAIGSLASANNTVQKIDNAGSPLTVTSAATPGEFQGTSPVVALAVALAAGLIAGIGIALIWDAFDDRLRDDDDLEALTGTPALGELSLDRRMQRRGDWLPAAGRKRTALNEGLRALRTTLQVLLPQARNVVVLTSVEPGDGKTFISSNLALAWARTGKRVILVGGDLRKPGLDAYFGDVATGPGLTELLQSASMKGVAPSTAEIAGSLNATKFRGLSILPAGSEPWDPADLLAVDKLGVIIDTLRSMSDIVIIDSPPSLAIVDASLLAAHSDGAVLVASVRRTRRKRLVETVHTLTGNGIPVIGLVANRSRRRIPKSYSAYYGSGSSGRRRPAAARKSDARIQAAPDIMELDDAQFVDERNARAASAEPDRRNLVSDPEPDAVAPDDNDRRGDSESGQQPTDEHAGVGRARGGRDSAEDEKS
ncbi:polysaccharide biosynthesis tyrosine autokinase [Humibacter sp.]|uniref:polysaccharide biosynthesis tyrosine autokinase n=1 Tax=Humibacter sp. TaxID=1940291 RepID=UPI003F7F47FF